MNYTGIIIEESLGDKSVLRKLNIVNTTVEIPEGKAYQIAKEISQSLDHEHSSWFADFKNDTHHYIVFFGKIFKIDLHQSHPYKAPKEYALSLGIPEYQIGFTQE